MAASETKLSELLKFFFDSFMFYRFYWYQKQSKEKNWGVNKFFDVNGVNGKI